MAELDSSGAPVLAQLPLEVRLRDDATLGNFLPLTAQKPLMQALKGQLESSGEPVIYLHGPSGCGKSHLLQASCQLSTAQTLYLPLQDLREYPAAEVLQGAENADRVCLDDLQAVLGDPDWELALFKFYNTAREQNCKLLVAADAAPRLLSLGLEDLRSRLSWGVVFQLARVDDQEKAAILQFRADRRGMSLSPEAASYIVSRAPRGMDQLLLLLDHLDQASLAQQRALSIPFVKGALGW
ncbi:MAG: DnaA family protein [Halioglobus sp.]|jgi:DnaA family protein